MSNKHLLKNATNIASGQYELNPPPTDAISHISFSNQQGSTKLLVASWDKNVYLYDAVDGSQNGNSIGSGENGPRHLINTFEHRAPVLDVCFGNDDNVAYSAGLDWDVRRYIKMMRPLLLARPKCIPANLMLLRNVSRIDLSTGEQTVFSSHTAGVNALVYSPEHHLLISASWDHTLHLHSISSDPSQPGTTTEPSTLNLPNKPFSLSLSPSKLIVAMAARQVYIYDLSALALAASQSSQLAPNEIQLEPFQRRESSLKFMTRALACMPNDAGYASSSIEGRVAVEWFDASPESQARKYAFKCHRQPAEQEDPSAEPTDIVYPVHGLAFHPQHGTFVSAGGDGFVALWDAAAKRRIRQYQRFPASVAAVQFSMDGKLLAVAVSPGFEEDKKGEKGGMAQGVVKVFVRELTEGETKGKGR